MLNTVYANRVNKSQIEQGAIIYWFKNDSGRYVAIASYGTLSLNDTIQLRSGTTHRFLGYLNKTREPYRKPGVTYYCCD